MKIDFILTRSILTEILENDDFRTVRVKYKRTYTMVTTIVPNFYDGKPLKKKQ